MSLALERVQRLDLDCYADAVGLHPEVVERLVTLGLLEAVSENAGGLWFAPSEVARCFRLQRLRANLTLNYAALGVVVDLLDRIAGLEAELRKRPRPVEASHMTGAL